MRGEGEAGESPLVIVGLLLAAGAAGRFGGGKLVALLPDGAPVGVRSARILASAVDRVVAVVRAGDDPLAGLLRADGIEILPFARASDGMGASLAFGVSSVPEAEGWLVALADMPFVRPSTAETVVLALKGGAAIAAAAFGGRRGHPVGFGATLFRELVQLRGDEGARSVLARHASQVVLLECDDPGVLRDVDVPSDLENGPQAI